MDDIPIKKSILEHTAVLYTPQSDFVPDADSEINTELIPTRKPGLKYTLDGHVQLFDDSDERTYHLNTAEGILWALADNKHSLAQVLKKAEFLLEHVNLDDTTSIELALESMASKSLLSFEQDNQIDYPISSSEYTHAVSTRGGVYLINRSSYKKIAKGMFFGLCKDGAGNLLAFDFPHYQTSVWNQPFKIAKKQHTDEGQILIFEIKDKQLFGPKVAYDRLANNTHYITKAGESLYSVDCEGQSIRRHNVDSSYTAYPVYDDGGYYHINTLQFQGNHAYVLKCLSSKDDGKQFSYQSSLGVFDEEWNQLSEIELEAERAHDLLFDGKSTPENPSFWVCDSKNGNLYHYPDGKKTSIRSQPRHGIATRGLAYDAKLLLCGSGYLGSYEHDGQQFRHRGVIVWWDVEQQKIVNELAIPEMPCCIVGISG